MERKSFKLNNGITVVANVCDSDQVHVALTVNVGHINEPKLGIATLFEQVLMKQSSNIQSVHGGTITSYFTGCTEDELEMTLTKIANLVKTPHFNAELVTLVAEDIIAHMNDLAPLPKRQMKLLYKHTAFAKAGKVWNTQAYAKAIRSYGVCDLQKFADKFMTGKNMVIAVSSKKISVEKVNALVEKCFGDVKPGTKHKIQNDIYTGGSDSILAEKSYRQVMMGWDVSGLSGIAEANVLMSMLVGRLERSFIGQDVDIEVKIAGYYGMRTLRISVTSHDGEDVNKFTDIICANVHRLRTTLASDRRMETSRNRAMSEKLFIFSQPQDGAVEIAWQLLGRGSMYDINERINATWQVSARDVQEIANDIFSRPLTYVVYAKEPFYSYEEVVAKL